MRKKNITSEMMMGYIAESLLCLMRQKRYAEISIGEIADRAGVNRSTYYRHFGAKEDIVRFFFGGVMDEYRAAFKKSGGGDLRRYLLVMFRTFFSHRDDLLLLHRAGLSALLLDVLNASFGFSSGGGEKSPLDRYRLSYHLGGIFNCLLLWFDGDMDDPPESMAEIALALSVDRRATLFAAG